MSNDGTPETWAYASDREDVFKMGFGTKAEALAGLGGQRGEVVRYECGIAQQSLDDLFDVNSVVAKLEKVLHSTNVIGDHENGLLADVGDAHKALLQDRLVDAVRLWVNDVGLHVWQIVDRVEIPSHERG